MSKKDDLVVLALSIAHCRAEAFRYLKLSNQYFEMVESLMREAEGLQGKGKENEQRDSQTTGLKNDSD